MPDEARVRIDSHRLMQPAQPAYVNERIEKNRAELEKQKRIKMNAWKRRAKIHVGIFAVSFIFTFGAFALGILLWVRPDELLPLVLVSVFSAAVFVGVFTTMRMFVLHTLLNEYPNKEEDPGTEHHLAKSISYGFVALVFAVMLAGIVVNFVSASII